MKTPFFFFALVVFLMTACNTAPNLEDDPSIQLNLPIYETEENPFVIAVANNGTVWQWKHERGKQIEAVQQLPINNVHSAGHYCESFGWALKNDGKVVSWNLEDPLNLGELEENKPIKKVSGSKTHLAYIFTDGTIGCVIPPYAFSDPVAGLVDLKNVTDIVCGKAYTLACTNDGKAFAAGSNRNFMVFENKEYIEGPYEIEGLNKIVKVGISSFDALKYAVDADHNLYYWGQSNMESGIHKVERKAKDLVSANYLLQKDGAISLMIEHRPRFGILDSLSFRIDPDFEDDLYYRNFNNKESHLVIDSEGKVIYYDEELTTRNGKLYGVLGDSVSVAGLRLDLGYFK